MSDLPRTGEASGDAEAASVDPGEPIPELADLREEPSARFVTGVLGAVHRRQMGTRLLEVAWWGVTGLLSEFLEMVFRALRAKDDTEKGPR
jgi:hypothetical protein